MKKLYTALLVIFLVLVIVVAVAGAALFGIYQIYLKPQPAEFEFSQTVSDISSIEVITVKRVSRDQLELVLLTKVEDTEGFIAEFNALECTKGLSLDAVATLAEFESLDAIRISYSDGSYEVITAYGNVDSSLFSPDFTVGMLLEEDFFFFDPAEFGALIEKYSEK